MSLGLLRTSERKAMMKIYSLIICSLILVFSAQAEIYKYQDKNGKWIYTDKKPAPAASQSLEKIEYKHNKSKVSKFEPKLHTVHLDGQYQIIAKNPLYAPVEISLRLGQSKKLHQAVIKPRSSQRIYQSPQVIGSYRYGWALGDPTASPDGYHYRFPVRSKMSHLITQGFNGRFSHRHPSSRHAVDIAMQIGTYLTASRAGRVIRVKDDYHMGGAKQYFLDKANVVNVLHEDGSYATYAHILQGTALVVEGDRVEVGQRLARSGSSGFSTGPHLHFVIRRNAGMKTISVPFQFHSDKKGAFTPRRGMKVIAVSN